MKNQFNVIAYIKTLKISDSAKIELENYMNSDKFQSDTDLINGDIEVKCKNAISNYIYENELE